MEGGPGWGVDVVVSMPNSSYAFVGWESRKCCLGPGGHSSRVICDSQVTLTDADQGVA